MRHDSALHALHTAGRDLGDFSADLGDTAEPIAEPSKRHGKPFNKREGGRDRRKARKAAIARRYDWFNV